MIGRFGLGGWRKLWPVTLAFGMSVALVGCSHGGSRQVVSVVTSPAAPSSTVGRGNVSVSSSSTLAAGGSGGGVRSSSPTSAPGRVIVPTASTIPAKGVSVVSDCPNQKLPVPVGAVLQVGEHPGESQLAVTVGTVLELAAGVPSSGNSKYGPFQVSDPTVVLPLACDPTEFASSSKSSSQTPAYFFEVVGSGTATITESASVGFSPVSNALVQIVVTGSS